MSKRMLDRRSFIKLGASSLALGASSGMLIPGRSYARGTGEFATIVEIDLCDGCEGEAIPRCVAACRDENREKFPEPRQRPIKDLWPQKTHDDWSSKRDIVDRLTPYNWLIVQRVEVGGRSIFIPRRCMHCDNPPCANLCPFGALRKFEDGAVVVNHSLCLGGAKCKSVCPWQIPQRQSGIGLYLKLQPMPAGGGVMYKCDMCHHRILSGSVPACVEACRSRNKNGSALVFGKREEIFTMARSKVREQGLYIYGDKENGGTATLYLSKIPFDAIDKALKISQKSPAMDPVEPRLKEVNKWARGFFLGPLAAAIGALALWASKTRGTDKEK